jgi:flavin-dependent dehydrogenase
MKKVVIIGAGVVGLILAKELGKLGHDVTVYDAKRDVKEGSAKASGILSKEGLASIGVAYGKAVVNTLDGAVLHAGREMLRIKSPQTKAYVLDRGKLAEECLGEARGAGAEVVFGRKIGKEAITAMKHDGGTVLVGADGSVSNVASACGFPPIKEYILTYKAEYEGAHVRDPHSVDLFFSNKVSSRFFGWTAPYSPAVLEAGIGISSFARSSSLRAFRQFIRNDTMVAMLDGAKFISGHASMIPVSTRKHTVIGNVLLVGDAAGQVKATTGGGIIFGASCAKIAAKAIDEHVRRGRPLGSYEKAWRRRYGLDLTMHKMLHSYYASMGSRSLDTLFVFSRIFGAEGFFSRYGDMDRPTVMIKRFFLRGMSR